MKAVGQKYDFDTRSIKAAIAKGLSSGSSADMQRPGRPLKISSNDQAIIDTYIVQKEGDVTLSEIKAQFDFEISSYALSSTLYSVEYYSFKKVRVQLLTEHDKLIRLNWCRKKLDWTLETWRLVCFSDESTLWKQWDTNQKVWRKIGGPNLPSHYKTQRQSELSRLCCIWGIITCFGPQKLAFLKIWMLNNI